MAWFSSKKEEPKEAPQETAKPQNVALSSIESWNDLMPGLFESPTGATLRYDRAMYLSAVYACVRVLAGAVSGLPLHVYQTSNGVREQLTDDSIARLLNGAVNTRMTSVSFYDYCVQQNQLLGDSISLIVRRGSQVESILPFDARNVGRVMMGNGRIGYTFVDELTAETYFVDQDDVLHFPGLDFDGVRSLSPIRSALGWSGGIGYASDEHAARYYANGGASGVKLEYPEKLSKDQVQEIQDWWNRTRGGVQNAHKPIVLTEGGKADYLQISAEEAQLLEARRYSKTDIASIFGVPPHMIGETERSTSWGTGLEQQSIGFVRYTLRPILKRMEEEINRKLIRDTDKFCKFSVDELLRGDSAGRSAYYREAIGGSQGPGWMTQNEVRAQENLPPVEDGDTLFTPNGTEDEPTENIDAVESGDSRPEDSE